MLYRREGDAWETQTFETMTDEITLPAIGAVLAFADIYDGIRFETPREP